MTAATFRPPTPGGKGGPAQQAARLAADHVKECIDLAVEVMRKPTRQSMVQLAAIKLLLELAGELEPEPVRNDRPRMTAAEAAAELRRRIEAGESR